MGVHKLHNITFVLISRSLYIIPLSLQINIPVQLLFQDGVLTLSEVKSTMRCLGKKLSGKLFGKLKQAQKRSKSRDV